GAHPAMGIAGAASWWRLRTVTSFGGVMWGAPRCGERGRGLAAFLSHFSAVDVIPDVRPRARPDFIVHLMTTRLCAYALTLALAAPALAAFGPPVVVTELDTGEPGKNGAHGAEGSAPPSAPSVSRSAPSSVRGARCGSSVSAPATRTSASAVGDHVPES